MASRELSDPDLRSFDHNIGELTVDGELKGYLACVVGRLVGGAPWPWFVIVWLDGRREPKLEDYGPDWPLVRELEAGYLDLHEPSTAVDRRFLGVWTYQVITPRSPCVYDFAWLPADQVEPMWQALGLRDEDF